MCVHTAHTHTHVHICTHTRLMHAPSTYITNMYMHGTHTYHRQPQIHIRVSHKFICAMWTTHHTYVYIPHAPDSCTYHTAHSTHMHGLYNTHVYPHMSHSYTHINPTILTHVYCTDTTHTHKWPQIMPPAYTPVLLPTIPYILHTCRHTHHINTYNIHTHTHILHGASQVAQWQRIHLPSCRCGFDPQVRKIPEEGNGNSLQYSYLEIPWIEEPGGLQPMGLQRAGHNRAAEQQQYTSYHTSIHITLTVQTCIHKTHTIQNAQVYSTPLT